MQCRKEEREKKLREGTAKVCCFRRKSLYGGTKRTRTTGSVGECEVGAVGMQTGRGDVSSRCKG